MANDARDRIVFDTNTFVSGYLFPKSIPGQAVELGLTKHRLLMSVEVARELADVLRREKFDRFLSLRHRDELIAETILDSEFITTSTIIKACRDPTDDKFLELAVDGRALAIVTGDLDLLALNPFQNIQILTPRDFLSRLPVN